MRKIASIFIVALLLMVVGQNSLLRADTKFGLLLKELETSIKWDFQEQSWRDRRAAWIEEVTAAGNVDEMKVLLKEFEQKIKWAAQEATWKGQRAGWLAKVNAATTQGELAQTLIAVEKSIKYAAQEASWKAKRSAWLQSVQALEQTVEE